MAPDVDAILAFANETDEGDRRRVEPALRHALTATLARDPRALDRFARTWPTLRADLVSTAVAAIGSTRDARGVDMLRQILSARPDQATTVMSQLRLLGPSPSAEVNATLAQMLRQELNPTDPQRCSAAAIALAVLEDIESVPILVSLLESESEGVKRDCAWALGQLTGMRFPAHPALWQRWLEAEQEWSRNGKHEALFRLRSVDPGQIAASIRELSSHRLYRHELSNELAKLLGSRNANLRRVACTGIQQLGSRQALPLLATVLDDQNPDVARAARLAIATIAEIDVDDPEELATVLASTRP